MKVLAIESSGRAASVALLDDLTPLAVRRLDREKKTAQSLVPAIQNVLSQSGVSAAQLDLVAVTVGPGSFTGLRIGVCIAKSLAFSTPADVVGVNSLHAICASLPATDSPVSVVLDAQRGELFRTEFARAAGKHQLPKAIGETEIISRQAWLQELTDQTLVCGPPLEKLMTILPTGQSAAEPEYWHPSAEAVGQIGFLLAQSGHVDDFRKLVPNYFRPSAAEERIG